MAEGRILRPRRRGRLRAYGKGHDFRKGETRRESALGEGKDSDKDSDPYCCIDPFLCPNLFFSVVGVVGLTDGGDGWGRVRRSRCEDESEGSG